MREQIISQIGTGLQQSIQLYFCGVEHTTFQPTIISLDEVIRELKPEIVLLEGRMPESTYEKGQEIGDFEDELKYLGMPSLDFPYWQRPNLTEIVSAVRSVGSKVGGFDLSDKAKIKLIRKYKLQYGRIISIYENLMDRTGIVLDERATSLSDAEYHEMEKLRADIYATDAGSSQSDDINSVIDSHRKFAAAVGSPAMLHKFIKSAAARLNRLAKDIDGYLQERESFIFNSIMAHYGEGKRVLVCIGSAHIEDNSHLLELVYRREIPFMKFNNYVTFGDLKR